MGPVLTWPVRTLPFLTWPVLNWPVLTWPVLTWPALTWPILSTPVQNYQITIRTSHKYLSDTLKTPSRYCPDTLKTPSRQPPDTRQTPSRQFLNTFQTPTRQSPKFRHVGAFLLLKARCGLFLLLLFFFRRKTKSTPTQTNWSLVGFASWGGVWQWLWVGLVNSRIRLFSAWQKKREILVGSLPPDNVPPAILLLVPIY